MECAICKDEYALEDKVKVLPCNHLFHGQCIDKWLENVSLLTNYTFLNSNLKLIIWTYYQSNVCPICRYEFETDDPEYDRMRKEHRTQMTSSSNSIPNANASANNTSTTQGNVAQNTSDRDDNNSNNNQNNRPSGSGSSANLSYFS